ncbi:TonB-dependent receptor [Sphingomonas koreensis]|uniref:TonB-dependent receptor n=1 Tax=Sphingomonas koreensis TaxID=93064 RepID=A0A430FZS0_9SPHN|nr:TonB-dependent receptor [Sphingomonas koreensis]RSY79364.1 TonB-dependent receptor [Sphingomonas koreensis]
MTMREAGGRREFLNQTSLIAMAFAAAFSTAAHAQIAPAESETTSEGEILVTGTRASLESSLNAKRNADSIVDVVTAEDVGKFPDDNVAETLQRVPGVSIDRQSGEGRFVSVNGLGPEFVSVLVNGRALANDNPDRSFSFDTLAPEVIRTVKVYKSANAIVPEGGIGGSIDVVTAKPFDFKGFVFSGQVGGLYEENRKKADPQASFLISDRFMDGRLGVLASFNWFRRHNRTYRVQNSAITPNVFFDFASYAYVADDDEDAFRMQDLERSVDDETRERIGGTLAVQFDATDDLQLTVDYLYSRLDVKKHNNSVMNWFYAVQDNASNKQDESGIYTVFDHALGLNASGYAFISTEEYRPTETHAGGFNAAWTVSDSLAASFDFSGSRAVNNNRGRDRSYTVEALNQGGFLVMTDGGVPYLEGPDLYVPGDNNQGALRARITSNAGTYTKSENWQARTDFVFTPAETVKVKFGASYASQRKQNDFYQTPEAIRRMYHSNATNLPIGPGIVTGILRPGDVFGNSRLNSDMFVIDGEALRMWMNNDANLAARRNPTAGLTEFIANGRSWDAVRSGDSYVIKEDVLSAYADVHLNTFVGGRPLDIVAGLRFTKTDVTSTGTRRILTNLLKLEASGILTPVYDPASLDVTDITSSYDNWLPSLNLSFEPVDNLILRLSTSKTLTRPVLESLAPSINYTRLFAESRRASSNNPFLKPFSSFNIDASVEWYFKKGSGLSASFFRKRISDYIVPVVSIENIDTIADPAYRSFSITRPENAERAALHGFTFAALHTFDFGLGFQANYTTTKGEVTALTGTNFSLPGLSDTANAVVFYEKDFFAVRLAYNWRDKFLAHPNYGGVINEPRFYTAYSQLDGRISFSLPHGIGLALDVVNITGEKVRSHGRSDNAFISYADYGRRYTLSLSKKF